MTEANFDSFQFLRRFWPDLYDLGRKAEQAGTLEPDLTAIRLRGFTEAMVINLFDHLELQYDPNSTHFDRLILLENADLLDARLLSKLHAIRKVGNNAAHNGRVTQAQAEDILEDAWSLFPKEDNSLHFTMPWNEIFKGFHITDEAGKYALEFIIDLQGGK